MTALRLVCNSFIDPPTLHISITFVTSLNDVTIICLPFLQEKHCAHAGEPCWFTCTPTSIPTNCFLQLHMVVEVTVATVDPINRSCDALVRGQSTSISGDSPAVRDLAISWNPGGGTFSLAPVSSSSWSAGSRKLPGKAELEVPLRAHCSSSSWHQALFW